MADSVTANQRQYIVMHGSARPTPVLFSRPGQTLADVVETVKKLCSGVQSLDVRIYCGLPGERLEMVGQEFYAVLNPSGHPITWKPVSQITEPRLPVVAEEPADIQEVNWGGKGDGKLT
jgi:hypothetical protein